ncbi:DUF445 family protein [bacterium]|nr:DUF445 family protein [bacterium]
MATEGRSRIGAISLGVAMAGAVASRLALRAGGDARPLWLEVLAAGFEAGVVGGLADWFAVTALFRHPLGLPIPHTAIIANRREKIVDAIVQTVESDWLSPDAIGARLGRLRPSELLLDWLGDPEHAERLGGPVRDVLRSLAAMLAEPEPVRFVERLVRERLRDLPDDRALALRVAQAVESREASRMLQSAAVSLANLAERPQTADELQWWIERSAEKMHEGGKRIVPFFLRRTIVQRKLIEAACSYASSELRTAALDPAHPLRRGAKDAVRRFAERLAAGDEATRLQAERLRVAISESLDLEPIVAGLLGRARDRLDAQLADPGSEMSRFVDRQLRGGIHRALDDPERRRIFDDRVREGAVDLLRRHHHQIGLTVRENLEALDTGALVRLVESRVGNDLQYIRLNGALVGGVIGALLASLRWLLG